MCKKKELGEFTEDYEPSIASPDTRTKSLEDSWQNLLRKSPLLEEEKSGDKITPRVEKSHGGKKTPPTFSDTLPILSQLTHEQLSFLHLNVLKADLTPTAKLLYLYLLATSSGTTVQMSLRRLAISSGLQRRVLTLSVKTLVEKHIIKKTIIQSGLWIDLSPGLDKFL